jgi:hypothetical protein
VSAQDGQDVIGWLMRQDVTGLALAEHARNTMGVLRVNNNRPFDEAQEAVLRSQVCSNGLYLLLPFFKGGGLAKGHDAIARVRLKTAGVVQPKKNS